MPKVPGCKHGSYNQRANGSWQVKYPCGWNEKTKKYEEYKEEAATEAEAIIAIKAINEHVFHGGLATRSAIKEFRGKVKAELDGKEISFSEFSSQWIDDRRKQGNVTARTVSDNESHLKRINSYIGEMPVKSITPRDIDDMYSGLRSDDARNNGLKPASGTYLQHIAATLKMVFARAVSYGIIEKNPVDAVERPKRDTKEKQSLSANQSRELVLSIVGEGLEAKTVGLVICLCCATRLSEMLALTWGDFNGDTLSVSKSLVKDSQEHKATKTCDVREDPCPAFLVDILNDWKAQQRQVFAEKDIKQTEKTPIVNNRMGAHTLKSTYERWFRQNKKRWPLPEDFNIHGLRHSATSIFQRDLGVDAKTTMSITGHKTMQMLGNYSHTDMAAKREAMRRMDLLIAPADDVRRCRNCRRWSCDPEDASRGVCWLSGKDTLFITDSKHECDQEGFLPKAG